jgi:hypothetical protein
MHRLREHIEEIQAEQAQKNAALPRLSADRIAVESQSLAAMELDEDAF